MPFAGFHGADLLIILAIALLIFGPKKLPEMGASIGKSIKEFKKGMNELTAPKEESPAAYQTIDKEPIVANYTATETEPLSETYYEPPTTVEAEVVKEETETHVQ